MSQRKRKTTPPRSSQRPIQGKPQVVNRFSAEALQAMEARASRPIPDEEQQALNDAADEAYELARTVEDFLLHLRNARLQQGLTQAQIDERTGIGRANLSRLENLHLDNPTLDTVLRYAQAVGLKVTLQPLDQKPDAA